MMHASPNHCEENEAHSLSLQRRQPLTVSPTNKHACIRCDDWDITDNSRPMPVDIAHSETIFSIGNGTIGVRGYPEETDVVMNAHYGESRGDDKKKEMDYINMFSAPSKSYWASGVSDNFTRALNRATKGTSRTTHFAGFVEQRVFTKEQCLIDLHSSESFLVDAPDAFCIDIFISGEHVSAATGRIVSHKRRLDLRRAELHRTMVWQSATQNYEATIESTRFASSVNRNVAAERLTVSVRHVQNAEIRIISRMNLPEATGGAGHHTRHWYTTENVSTLCSIQDAASVIVLRTKLSCRRLAVVSVETCTSTYHSNDNDNNNNTNENSNSAINNNNNAANKSSSGADGVGVSDGAKLAHSAATSHLANMHDTSSKDSGSNTSVSSETMCTSSQNSHDTTDIGFPAPSSHSEKKGAGCANVHDHHSRSSRCRKVCGRDHVRSHSSYAQQQQEPHMMNSNSTGGDANHRRMVTFLTPKSAERSRGTETSFTSCISDAVTIQITKFVGYFGDEDARQEELLDTAVYRTRHAANFGFTALRQEHRHGMSEFWNEADVVVRGCAAMQAAVRFNLLQLHMSASHHPRHGFPTRSLYGAVTLGARHRWDVDVWVGACLAHIAPERALTLLLFRIAHLGQARAMAASVNLTRGALYSLNTVGGGDSSTPNLSAYLFVNALVALSMRYYILVTQDYDVLTGGGAEVVLATALVWSEWGRWEKGSFHLRYVCGPDVYNGLADDNFFTNTVAQEHLQWTVELAAYMTRNHPGQWQQVMERCRASEEDVYEMQRIASKMTLVFDSTQRIYPADASFMRKKPWPDRLRHHAAAAVDEVYDGMQRSHNSSTTSRTHNEDGHKGNYYSAPSTNSDIFAFEKPRQHHVDHPDDASTNIDNSNNAHLHGNESNRDAKIREESTVDGGSSSHNKFVSSSYWHPLFTSSRSSNPDSIPGLRLIPPTRATSMTPVAVNTAQPAHDVDTCTSNIGSDNGGAGAGVSGSSHAGATAAAAATTGNALSYPHPYVIFRHRYCRIPDVLLAMMLFLHRFTDDEVRANLRFYEGITSAESSLRFPILATLSARLQMAEKASYYLNQTLFVDLCDLMGDSAGGTHCTTAAGMWYTLAFGFAGMRVEYRTLHFNPSVPVGMTGYRFHARHQGCLLRVEVSKAKVVYTLLELHASCPAQSLSIVHGGRNRIELCVGAPASMQLVHPARILGFDAMIFDLDSLLVNVEDVHYASWKTAFEEHFGNRDGESRIAITKELYLAYLRHNVPLSGLREVCKKYNLDLVAVGHPTDAQEEGTLYALCNRKLNVFRRYVQQNGLCVREGAVQLLSNLRDSGVKLGCVSSSKNGRWVVDELPELHSVFGVVLDGNVGAQQKLRWRPEMEFFTMCAQSLVVTPKRCIIVVDGVNNYSKSCIENFCMVVDVSTEPETLSLSVTRLCTQNYRQLTSEVLNVYALSESSNAILGADAAGSRTTEDTAILSRHADPSRV